MPRHERAPEGHAAAAGPGPLRLAFRRDADGKVELLAPPRPTVATTEAAEKPPTPDDPRQGPLRDVPPLGAA